ncbi:hydroxyquinol 1,2-dioxygenase [Burkholderia multivorans]|uniref:hydroxyquinol 1,2-dioxygenase n=1 Tax=Burkholderia multivorans TaxID=87883 RepID=UPI0019D221FD|nr:hydroxyquinol 1,2-dioxygenase [Burkholderia multivorans]MBN6731242.1 hydroxyquinol 1,2-dioxygenase [Burkholderia multivorans]MBN6733488.1 hydroxyquinol 1,2-dioxygenase [Burkholderia multivorans]MBN7130588.1 hydroxyquinol 1,2-dioxygenase [Burkholderia multivorans]MBN8165056.1 hydroxyquinol 1,2-dioxygenase [Burkholderia multivorans]MBN8170845.1 hydroxyquinol 1,2-dioxygenase [Burkholderia multivorans]
MTDTSFHTVLGSLDSYRKGEIEITSGDARHYVFSNVFEVASRSTPYEKVVVGKNLEYVIETLRTEGQSTWFACAHDEFVILLDGEVRIDFIKLDKPPKGCAGTVLAGEHPAGRPMGHVVLRRGHQALLPAGCAYRFSAQKAGVALVQTVLGELSVEKWADICLH